jgi:hypothetical protein
MFYLDCSIGTWLSSAFPHSLHVINETVYCAVRTISLNVIQVNFKVLIAGNKNKKSITFYKATFVTLHTLRAGLEKYQRDVSMISNSNPKVINASRNGHLTDIWHSEDRASLYNRIIEAKTMHYLSTLSWYTTLHVSGSLTVHHQESWYCIHSTWYLSYYLCWLSASEVRMESQHIYYDKYQLLWMHYQDSWWWTVSLSETCRVVYQNTVVK